MLRDTTTHVPFCNKRFLRNKTGVSLVSDAVFTREGVCVFTGHLALAAPETTRGPALGALALPVGSGLLCVDTAVFSARGSESKYSSVPFPFRGCFLTHTPSEEAASPARPSEAAATRLHVTCGTPSTA